MKYRETSQNKGGYIAITMALVLMLIVLAAGLSLGLGAFLGRFDSLVLETKSVTRSLAKSCGEVALLKLASTVVYGGNESVTIDGYQCAILPIEIQPGQLIIKTTATVDNITTNLKMTVNNYSLNIISKEEVQNF